MITIKEAMNVKQNRVYLDMTSFCSFLNKLLELEKKFAGKGGNVEEASFYAAIRGFTHHALLTVNQFYRWKTVLHVLHMWEGSARMSLDKEEKRRMKSVIALAHEYIRFKTEPTDIDVIVVFLPKEGKYQKIGEQW